MAKVFLDANYFIDLVKKRRSVDLSKYHNQLLYISPLSLHIFIYIYKCRIPDNNLIKITDFFSLVAINRQIVRRSLQGPTDDFEDNLQLHSAAEADCDLFLTLDKKLLKLGFFGTVEISRS